MQRQVNDILITVIKKGVHLYKPSASIMSFAHPAGSPDLFMVPKLTPVIDWCTRLP